MRILVTGSHGTLGRPLMRELRERGHQVFGCDLKHSEDPQEMRADVADGRQVDRVFGTFEPELVYHLAAEFGRHNGQDYYENLWRSNQIGTRNVIGECVSRDVKLVLASSSEVYGDNPGECYLQEEHLDMYAPRFHNEYALSKWVQERQVFIAAKNDGLKSVVVRFFNAYGKGEYYTPYRSVVCLFCYRMMFGLPITVYKGYHRVFMHVSDWALTVANVADRFDKLLPVNGRPPVYNAGGTEYRSVEELFTIIAKALGKTAGEFDVQFLDKEAANVTNKRPDISRAAQDLGHNPTITLEEGVPHTIEWLRGVYDAYGHLTQARISPQLTPEGAVRKGLERLQSEAQRA